MIQSRMAISASSKPARKRRAGAVTTICECAITAASVSTSARVPTYEPAIFIGASRAVAKQQRARSRCSDLTPCPSPLVGLVGVTVQNWCVRVAAPGPHLGDLAAFHSPLGDRVLYRTLVCGYDAS